MAKRPTPKAKRSLPGKTGRVGGVPDLATIRRLQEAYYKAVWKRGNIPRDILAKHQRSQKLYTKYAKLFEGSKQPSKADLKALDQLGDLLSEVASYFHFKVDDVDWDAPDVQDRLARGEMVWRRRHIWEQDEEE